MDDMAIRAKTTQKFVTKLLAKKDSQPQVIDETRPLDCPMQPKQARERRPSSRKTIKESKETKALGASLPEKSFGSFVRDALRKAILREQCSARGASVNTMSYTTILVVLLLAVTVQTKI